MTHAQASTTEAKGAKGRGQFREFFHNLLAKKPKSPEITEIHFLFKEGKWDEKGNSNSLLVDKVHHRSAWSFFVDLIRVNRNDCTATIEISSPLGIFPSCWERTVPLDEVFTFKVGETLFTAKVLLPAGVRIPRSVIATFTPKSSDAQTTDSVAREETVYLRIGNKVGGWSGVYHFVLHGFDKQERAIVSINGKKYCIADGETMEHTGPHSVPFNCAATFRFEYSI